MADLVAVKPFAPLDVDTIYFDFTNRLGLGETLSSYGATASGGFTGIAAVLGSLSGAGQFTVNPAGAVVQVTATAGAVVGKYIITCTVSVTGGDLLHRAVIVPVLVRT